MATLIQEFAPFIPGDEALDKSPLPDKAVELSKKSAKLAGQLAPITLTALEQYMQVINSYYSNLIEGNATRPQTEIPGTQYLIADDGLWFEGRVYFRLKALFEGERKDQRNDNLT